MNAGAINAAQASLQAADGNVYALAGNSAAIRATGTQTRDGHVWLVADGGTVHAKGTAAAVNADGSGGTVETRGNALDVSGANIQAGNWKLGAPTFTIDGATATTLGRNLSRGTSVDVETTGANGTSGDLAVNGNVRWNGNAALTLGAAHSVSIGQGATIANTGGGNLTVRADAAGANNGGGIANGGTIDWSKSIGIVSALYDMNGTYAPGTLLSNSAAAGPPRRTAARLRRSPRTSWWSIRRTTCATCRRISPAINALGKDIDASVPSGGIAFTPIGLTTDAPFTGQFDGFGHAIDKLSVGDSVLNVGLFGVIGEGGAVRNIDVTNGHAGGVYGSATYGILADRNYGTVAYTSTSGTAGNSAFGGVGAGGLVAYNDGLITQSYATGNIISFTGGALVSTNGPNGVIDESFATDGVGGGGSPGEPMGGIAAYNQGTINNVYWDKDATRQTTASNQNIGTMPPDSNALASAQMIVPTNFVGWNFNPGGTWTIPENGTHPVLQWQQATP